MCKDVKFSNLRSVRSTLQCLQGMHLCYWLLTQRGNGRKTYQSKTVSLTGSVQIASACMLVIMAVYCTSWHCI